MAYVSAHHALWLHRPFLTASALGLTLALPTQAAANPFGTPPVSERSLSDMRGGFDLPNGMKVTLGVQIETFVDNSLALRTVLNVTDKVNSALQITVPVTPAIVTANPIVAAATGGTTITPVAVGVPNAQLAATGAGTPPDPGTAVAIVPLAADSTPAISTTALPQNLAIQSELGTISVEQTGAGAAVILKGPDLEIQHLTGGATGVLIANTLDNRAIDTVATVNISLGDSAVPIGNMMMRIESVVLDAVRGAM